VDERGALIAGAAGSIEPNRAWSMVRAPFDGALRDERSQKRGVVDGWQTLVDLGFTSR
jgi:hypothetical protein